MNELPHLVIGQAENDIMPVPGEPFLIIQKAGHPQCPSSCIAGKVLGGGASAAPIMPFHRPSLHDTWRSAAWRILNSVFPAQVLRQRQRVDSSWPRSYRCLAVLRGCTQASNRPPLEEIAVAAAAAGTAAALAGIALQLQLVRH